MTPSCPYNRIELSILSYLFNGNLEKKIRVTTKRSAQQRKNKLRERKIATQQKRITRSMHREQK
jgi:hypothetical protein